MKNYLFQVIDGYNPIDVQNELQKKGLQDIYVIEDDATGATFLGGRSRKKMKSPNAFLIEEKASVNWESQWELFASDFKDGKAHINLSSFGAEKTLLLLPGAGFGDLSHPTTHLMLEMMKERVTGQTVIDIGTGSGILTLAAIMLGACQGIGIDIDQDALKHAKKNAKLNNLTDQTKFSKILPKKIPKNSVFLMNMILPEQKEFDPSQYKNLTTTWIVSGILIKQKKEYLKQAAIWGWRPIKEFTRLDWIGWIFSTIN